MVMAYHGGIAGLSTAGYFGVDVFFVLSGCLITTLLLEEQASKGRIALASFWARRARRLLPGLLVMLVAVDIYVAWFAPSGRYPTFRGDALSVLAYSSNWHFIAASSNYFAATGVPSLLTHTWSLAIEEQFYLVWPLVLLVAVRIARRLRRSPASVVLTISAAGVAGSATAMAMMYRSGSPLSRLYYGTDTHAQSILIGAALSALAASRPASLRRIGSGPVSIASLAVLGWAACTLGSNDSITYQGGFLLVGLASAGLVGGVAGRPSGLTARVLSIRPLEYVGRISYGMYLWYFPLFAVVNRASTGLSGLALFAVRCAADTVLAAASFHLVEQPVRRLLTGRRGVRLSLSSGALAIASVGGLVLADSPAAFSLSAFTEAGQSGPAYNVPTPPGTLRILVIGDSTAATLGIDMAWPDTETQYHYAADVRATFGCGVALGAAVLEHGVEESVAPACNVATPAAQQWPALLRQDLARDRPDVVLLVAGRWEVSSRRQTPGGPWVDITQPATASYVTSELETAAALVRAGHATFALATAPCFSSGETASGGTWTEDLPSRVIAYNAVVRSVAASDPAHIRVVDLDAMVCPGGTIHTSIDGVTVRAPDGVHYPLFNISAPASPAPDTVAQAQAFGAWIAPRILAALSG